jgi:hypothetical protein
MQDMGIASPQLIAEHVLDKLLAEECTVELGYNSHETPDWPSGINEVGQWLTGSRMSDNAATYCALLDGDEHLIKVALGAREIRFIEPRPDDYVPGDRFPMPTASAENA